MDRDRDLGDGVANSVLTLDQGAHCRWRSAVADGGRFAIGGNGKCLARNRATNRLASTSLGDECEPSTNAKVRGPLYFLANDSTCSCAISGSRRARTNSAGASQCGACLTGDKCWVGLRPARASTEASSEANSKSRTNFGREKPPNTAFLSDATWAASSVKSLYGESNTTQESEGQTPDSVDANPW